MTDVTEQLSPHMGSASELRRAVAVLGAGHWPRSQQLAQITLPFCDRHRRRLKMRDDRGDDFLLDLERATVLGHGDGLQLESGGYVLVRAELEAVADIYCRSTEQTASIAWHIGNRHTPLQILGDDILRILDDHVLVTMLEGLGARVDRHFAVFAPMSGAYQSNHDHEH